MLEQQAALLAPALAALALGLFLAWVAALLSKRSGRALERRLAAENERLRQELERQMGATRQEMSRTVQDAVGALGRALVESQMRSGELQDKRLEELNEQFTLRSVTLQKTVGEQLARVDARLESFSKQSELRLEGIRSTMENRLTSLQDDNAKKLEQMRQTVDEKLQKTLDERLSQSFSQVSDRLEQVYKGLGEMQTLAAGVGDLKRVLSNVKTRGILGEIQLGAILEQILAPEQYAANVATKKGSAAVVEYAVRLPGDGEQEIWLPVDAKFPGDAYSALMEAYEAADSDRIALTGRELEKSVKQAAKDISDKYIDPPGTTDFAIMFLPFEGLYAEVVRRGMLEILARDYKVNIAGPSTMAALLNSLQMGFRTLAIQKRSSEVWQVLGAVKTEFGRFSTVLQAAQGRLRKAGEELDTLIGTRTKAIERKLRQLQELPTGEARALLELPEDEEVRNG